MIKTPEIIIQKIAVALGDIEVDNHGVLPDKTIEATGFSKRYVVANGTTMLDLSLKAARQFTAEELGDIGGVIVATFSNEKRFPALAVSIASHLGLPSSIPAFDLQMACSAYPYAIYLAGRMAADTNKRILVIDGDIQSALSDQNDLGTTPLFSDAATATLVASGEGTSYIDFFSKSSDALSCAPTGPITMDGFGVFSFVAGDVVPFLKSFVANAGVLPVDHFVPHQANMYMVRQMASSLGMTNILATSGQKYANVGSASIPLTIADSGIKGRVLIAGFGAGLSASAAVVTVC